MRHHENINSVYDCWRGAGARLDEEVISMILDAGRCLSDRKSWLAFAVGIFVGIVLTNIQVASVNGGAGCARMASNLPVWGVLFESSLIPDNVPAMTSDSLSLWQVFEADTDMLTEVKARNQTLSGEQNEAMSQLKAAYCSKLDGVVPGPLIDTVKSQRTNPVVAPNRSGNADLADLLEKVAIRNELVVAVVDNSVRAALQIWFENIKRVGFKNYMAVALDDDVAAFCTENGVPVHRRDAEISVAQQGMGSSSSKVSGLKYLILREFLVLGYSILLSDVDIIYLQNPFDHLYRDCDLESMTDGFDNATAYGANVAIDDPVMGWSRYAHTMRIFVFNSGLFYVRPTLPSIELLDRVIARLAVERAWDQTVFNEELFYPSYPGYDGLHASRRVLDYYQFMNSKVLFLQVRKDLAFADFRPVTIHVNYHHDKHERLLAIVEYYVNGNKTALDPFPDGSY